MAPLNVNVIRQSYNIAKPMINDIIDGFFDILIKDHPETQSLIAQTDRITLSKAFVSVLNSIIDSLDKEERLNSYLSNQANRQQSYGIKPEYYAWFRSAFLLSFSSFFGDEWKGQFAEEWAKGVDFVFGILRNGPAPTAKGPTPEAPKIASPEPIRPLQPAPAAAPAHQAQAKAPAQAIKTSLSTYQIVLSNDVKDSIKKAVRLAVGEAVKEEIAKALESELAAINEKEILSYFPKAS